MNYITVADTAKKWNVSPESVRRYCRLGKVEGAVLVKKAWNLPENAEKPRQAHKKKVERTLLNVLQYEKKFKISGGIYHKLQIDLTYNSNHIEGSKLTHDQTRYIFETNTIGVDGEIINVDDVIETANHFRCIDIIIDCAKLPISEPLIKKLHAMLKGGTHDSRNDWFNVGKYKKLPNEVGGKETTLPEDVPRKMAELIDAYNSLSNISFSDIIGFHHSFEQIHPFQDGNGRVGRLIMFKECLRHNIVPFIIDEETKAYYYRGLSQWNREKGFLMDTCLHLQDKFKNTLDYFKIV